MAARANKGISLLHAAARGGLVDLVRCLLENGADVDCKTHDYETPLHFAATGGRKETTRLLLKNGANANVKSVSRFGTPLLTAAFLGHAEVAHDLIHGGADVSASTAEGYGLAHAAAQGGLLDLLAERMQHGITIHTRTNPGKTLLHYAAGHLGRVSCGICWHRVQTFMRLIMKERRRSDSAFSKDIIRILLASGAHIAARDSQGRISLHLIAESGEPDAAMALLLAGADINAKDSEGRTPTSLGIGADRPRHVGLPVV